MGELFNLLGLLTSTEDEETAGEADTENDEDDECYQKLHHRWSHGGVTTRVVSNDESWNDGHC